MSAVKENDVFVWILPVNKRPLLKFVELFVVGQIDLNGDDGDITVVEGPFVSIFGVGFGVVEVADEPIIIFATRVLSAFEIFSPVATGLAAGAHSFDLFFGQIGEVDIEAEGAFRFMREGVVDQVGDIFHDGAEVGIGGVVEQGETD